jgi:phosphoadenosine phosphosulfate reductase
MRWCCFTNKGAPFAKFYAELEHKHVLSFDGIRAQESQSRARYERDRDNTKYQKQYSAYPIFEWTTLEVWLYIFWNNLKFNELYEHGFARVGCWACPNNTMLDWFFFSKAHPDQVKSWFDFLDTFRKQQNTKMEEGEEYDLSWLEDGFWKQRRVRYNNIDNLVNISRQELHEDAGYGMIIDSVKYDLELKFPLTPKILDFLTVFGKPVQIGENSYTIRNKDLEIIFKINDTHLEFKIFNLLKEKDLKKLIARQINKVFNCIDCGACVGSCIHGAISINPKLHINPEKCNNCLVCTGTKYLDMSCIGIHYKENRKYIKLNEI